MKFLLDGKRRNVRIARRQFAQDINIRMQTHIPDLSVS